MIGVNDYPGTQNDLSSAVNDADDMAQALDVLGVDSDHVITLRDGQVTRNTLLDAVSWLASHAGPDSVAGFFYAGHIHNHVGQRGNRHQRRLVCVGPGTRGRTQPRGRQPLVGCRGLLRRRLHRGVAARACPDGGGRRQRPGLRELHDRPQLHRRSS